MQTQPGVTELALHTDVMYRSANNSRCSAYTCLLRSQMIKLRGAAWRTLFVTVQALLPA